MPQDGRKNNTNRWYFPWVFSQSQHFAYQRLPESDTFPMYLAILSGFLLCLVKWCSMKIPNSGAFIACCFTAFFFLQVANFMNLHQEQYRGLFSCLVGKFLAKCSSLSIYSLIRKTHHFCYILFETKTLKVVPQYTWKFLTWTPEIMPTYKEKHQFLGFVYCCFHEDVPTTFIEYNLYYLTVCR